MLLPKFDFHGPTSLDKALTLKKEHIKTAKILAGGTDLLVNLKKGLTSCDHIISLTDIRELSEIKLETSSVTIGACVTMTSLSCSGIIKEKFPALKSGADSLGNHLIRNRATIGGNVCNASPAGDTLPALITYGAMVILENIDGKREVEAEHFFTGAGKTKIQDDEILTGFRLPIPDQHTGAHYIQLGKRKSSEINVVNVASFVQYDPALKKIINARIALGSVAATPIRSRKAETLLKNQIGEDSLFIKAGETARKEDCKPMDDFRGTARYRQAMVGVLTKRTLCAAFEQAKNS